MSHELDFSLGRAAIAYVGDTPWHQLGSRLTPGANIGTWIEEAGMDWDANRSPVYYRNEHGNLCIMAGKSVLYRDDTNAPLSIVSDGYKIVQPRDIMNCFAQLADLGGFSLETAGCLSYGRRVWALAKINDGAPLIGHDVIRPYLLMGTSYDGTMATTARLTMIRVVCDNTISAVVGRYDIATGKMQGGEDARESGAVVQSVRVPHTNNFDFKDVRMKLGIFKDGFEKWMIETRILAEREVTQSDAEILAHRICLPFTPKVEGKPGDVRQSNTYKRVMDLFQAGPIGSEIDGGPSMWRMLNAVTQHVDHEKGRNTNSRVTSAWFGQGEALKNHAYRTLMAAAV